MSTNQKLADRFASYDAAAQCGYVPNVNAQAYAHYFRNRNRYSKKVSLEVFQDDREVLEHVDNGRKILAASYACGDELHVAFAKY